MSDSVYLPPLVPQTQGWSLPGPLRRMLERLSREWRGPRLLVELPGGRRVAVGPAAAEEPARLRIRDYRCLRRVLAAGDIGFGEGYMAGEWDSPDLARLLTVLARNFEALERLGVGGPASRLLNLGRNLFRGNSERGARRNIHAHYDLGNAFYGTWLDEGMTYSSALYAQPDQPLDSAQREKYAALARMIGLKPGHTVLEIGCGWGGFAEFAAREIGARVVGLTISAAQHAYACERIAKAELTDRVDIRLCDYRRVEGAFDRIVSIEMFEAVGQRYWPLFFDTVRERLKPGGRAGLQIITIRDELFVEYRRRVDFIQKHVFPGGVLPSEERLRHATDAAGLAWSDPLRFGPDYARTLAAWADRFERAWPRLEAQGFDERFRRLWRFYLAYCEAGFATGRTDVVQLALDRP